MTRTEHLLSCLAEECNEVAQRASKALRFGLTEIQEGQEFTNAQRIRHELDDLLAIVEMLADAGHLDPYATFDEVAAKKTKVERFLAYSAECGTLTADTEDDIFCTMRFNKATGDFEVVKGPA